MSILTTICAHKQKEIQPLIASFAPKNYPPVSNASDIVRTTITHLKNYVRTSSRWNMMLTKPVFLIAEIKPKSPSAGTIRSNFNASEIAHEFEHNGASAISVLTDYTYFGGSLKLLKTVQSQTTLPLLRKEFILHPAQVYQTQQAGATLILLIAKCLTAQEIANLAGLSLHRGLVPIIEVNSPLEAQIAVDSLQHLNRFSDIIFAVNNRDLDTMDVSLETSKKLFSSLPSQSLTMSLSGMKSITDIKYIASLGYDGVLIGEGLASDDFWKTATHS